MSQQLGVPKVRELVTIDLDNGETTHLYIYAVDLEEGVWVCIDPEDNEIILYSFDENCNARRLDPSFDI